jgi:hypothetical protein
VGASGSVALYPLILLVTEVSPGAHVAP